MEPLAPSNQTEKGVFRWIDVTVVRLVAPQVCRAVDEPGAVKGDGVSHEATDEECFQKRLTPEVAGDEGRQDKTHQHHRWKIDSII